MSKQDIIGTNIQLTLQNWGRLGSAMSYLDDRLVFVFGGIPGEEVIAKVISQKRNYIAAEVVEILNPSPKRIKPPCIYFGNCTGCQLQHIDYQYQIKLKQQTLVDSLQRVGGFIEPHVLETIPSPKIYEYRNHARFTIGNQGDLGFINRESRKFIPIEHCMIMDNGINEIMNQLHGLCSETTQLSIRYGINTGEFLVQPILKNQDLDMPTGQKHYKESIRKQVFQIASPSFFQVNIQQLDTIVEIIKETLQLSGSEVLVDAYAGVGTFAILLAPYAGKIIAIEDSSAAIEDAKINGAKHANIEFLLGKTEEMLSQLEEKPYAVILDPSRKGCHPDTLKTLQLLKPHKIVYISCDPNTLARDLNILCKEEFYLEEVQPIDMFPQTHHIESISTLGLRTSLDNLVLASSSPRRQQLLTELGIPFSIKEPSINENIESEDPYVLVKHLALEKTNKIATDNANQLIVGADTVVFFNGKVMGKPKTNQEAKIMLESLRGNIHQVITGIAVVDRKKRRSWVQSEETTVKMRFLSDEEIESYVNSGDPMDKAGSYAIQDASFKPAEVIEGCLSNAIGLPACSLIQILDSGGYDCRAYSLPEDCKTHLLQEGNAS